MYREISIRPIRSFGTTDLNISFIRGRNPKYNLNFCRPRSTASNSGRRSRGSCYSSSRINTIPKNFSLGNRCKSISRALQEYILTQIFIQWKSDKIYSKRILETHDNQNSINLQAEIPENVTT